MCLLLSWIALVKRYTSLHRGSPVTLCGGFGEGGEGNQGAHWLRYVEMAFSQTVDSIAMVWCGGGFKKEEVRPPRGRRRHVRSRAPCMYA